MWDGEIYQRLWIQLWCNIYANTEDKEAVNLIKEARTQFGKERREEELEQQSQCRDISGAEYVQLEEKTIKTKDAKLYTSNIERRSMFRVGEELRSID